MAFASLSLTLLALLGSVPTASAAPDVGYLELFVTHNRTVPLTCTPGTFPAALDGTFLLPSLGQFENAGKSFQGLLDGYVCGRGARVNLKRPVRPRKPEKARVHCCLKRRVCVWLGWFNVWPELLGYMRRAWLPQIIANA